jgi:hypothetical protein
MGIFDSNLLFSNNVAITAGGPSSVIDLQGGLLINAGQQYKAATPQGVFGEDIGIGDGVAVPKIAAFVTTAFAAAGAATLQVQAQYAPDTAQWPAGGGYPLGPLGGGAFPPPGGTPGAWVTAAETPATGIPVTSLVAGAKICAFDWPPAQLPSVPLPRYLRLNYVVGTGPFTAGVLFAGLVLQRQDNAAWFYPNNFVVGP